MTTRSYRFKLGAFNCLAVIDGTHVYHEPVEILFPDAPRDLLARALEPHGKDPRHWPEWISDYTCLLVDTGTHRVLMDTGAGRLLPGAGKLVENLQRSGIDPGEIDLVVISHAHPDHLGGALFPNARIVIQQREWGFWTGEPELPRLSSEMREVLIRSVKGILPMVADGIELIDGDTQLLPGIKTVAAPGHTPGHMAVSITSQGRELLYTGDAILHPIHMEHPEWSAIVDVIPEEAEATRRRLLAHAAANDIFLFCFHFPFPGLGRVRAKGDTWQWEPIYSSGQTN
jgi:glyoxylase-like metal-dependent hydrolase (beta-lactamase superfamily II)